MGQVRAPSRASICDVHKSRLHPKGRLRMENFSSQNHNKFYKRIGGDDFCAGAASELDGCRHAAALVHLNLKDLFKSGKIVLKL